MGSIGVMPPLELKEQTKVLIERDVSLRALNTLGIGSRAEYFASIRSEQDLKATFAFQRVRHLSWFVLGGGSNVVLPVDYPGLVLAMRMRGVRIEPVNASGESQVEAAAGESWHGLVRRCLGQGLCGIEHLALIPGTVGAAPMQNIGAYGAELADVFVGARVYLPDEDRFVSLSLTECEFSYRDSVFRHRLRDRAVITSVTLRLKAQATARTQYPDVRIELQCMGSVVPSAIDVAEAVIRVRRRKLPDVRHLGNVGSFFKNPVVDATVAETLVARHPALRASTRFDGDNAKLAAAALIESAGWKGRVVGRVEVWRRQPLVLVNRGGATREDVLALADAIGVDVFERFGVKLNVEPRLTFDDALLTT